MELLQVAVEAGGEDREAGEGGDRGDEGGQPDWPAGPVDDLPGEGVQQPQGHHHHLTPLHYGQDHLSLLNLGSGLADVVPPLVPDIH